MKHDKLIKIDKQTHADLKLLVRALNLKTMRGAVKKLVEANMKHPAVQALKNTTPIITAEHPDYVDPDA